MIRQLVFLVLHGKADAVRWRALEELIQLAWHDSEASRALGAILTGIKHSDYYSYIALSMHILGNRPVCEQGHNKVVVVR